MPGQETNSPPRRGGREARARQGEASRVAAPVRRCREATETAQTGWSVRCNCTVSPLWPPRPLQ